MFPLNQNPGAATAINCIVNEVNDCVFRKICESFNKFWKFCLKIWKCFKTILKVLKKMLINISKNKTKIIIFYYYLFLLLAEAWVVPHPLQLFRGFVGGGGSFPLPQRLRHWCTLYNVQWNFSNFPISNPMQINMKLILPYFHKWRRENHARFFDMPWVKSLVH